MLLERPRIIVAKPAAAAPAATAPATTEAAATALRLRPLLLLKSAEIEELRGAGSDNAEHQPSRDCQRNQRAAFGKDAQLS